MVSVKVGGTFASLSGASVDWSLCHETAQIDHSDGLFHAKPCLGLWLWTMPEQQTVELLRVLHPTYTNFIL